MINKQIHLHCRNEKGQVVVEYILLLAAVTAIIFSLMGQLKLFLIADQGKCTPQSRSLTCQFERSLTLDGFRRFRVIR